MSSRTVNTLLSGRLSPVTLYFVHILLSETETSLLDSVERVNDHRNYFMIISIKVMLPNWDHNS